MAQHTSVKWIRMRIVIVSVGFVLFLSAVLFRSYQLQIASNTQVTNLAARQYRAKVQDTVKRGTIYDRNGKELALDIEVASVSVHPSKIENPNQLATDLAKILNLPTNKILEKLTSKKSFEWIARRVPAEMGKAIADLHIDGLTVERDFKRFYPNKDLAGNVLGAVGYDAKALGGLELSLDSYLRGSVSANSAQKDAKGRLFTPVTPSLTTNDVTLTLDVNIQYITDKYLEEQAEKHRVKSAFAIVMDPKTGELLAMSNYPRFNPNTYWDYPQENWKNHAILDSFEPGSTFKAMVAAAALQNEKVRPTDIFFCENGQMTIGDHVIHDHGRHGNLTVSDIIKVSSNIGVTKIAQKLGKQPYYEMLTALGFGQTSGIGLAGEERGILRSVKSWTPIDQSNIAFGQGVTVTGMQMVSAYSTMANQGLKMKPYLVSKVVDSRGTVVVDNRPTPLAQLISPDHAKEVTSMLESVVEEGGTGTMADLGGYQVAGKTGTAQKVDPQTHRYANGQFVSSFIGYVPTNDPQFVIYVVYDTPQGDYFGSVVATPVFRDIAREALAYRGIIPAGKINRLAKEEVLPR